MRQAVLGRGISLKASPPRRTEAEFTARGRRFNPTEARTLRHDAISGKPLGSALVDGSEHRVTPDASGRPKAAEFASSQDGIVLMCLCCLVSLLLCVLKISGFYVHRQPDEICSMKHCAMHAPGTPQRGSKSRIIHISGRSSQRFAPKVDGLGPMRVQSLNPALIRGSCRAIESRAWRVALSAVYSICSRSEASRRRRWLRS